MNGVIILWLLLTGAVVLYGLLAHHIENGGGR